MPTPVKKFTCLRCGACCRTFQSENSAKPGSFVSPITYLLNEQHLSLYDWEVKGFREELAKINAGRKVLPSVAFIDLKNKRLIAVNYTLDGENCPFLKDNMCIIYNKRPIACRQFPCVPSQADVLFNYRTFHYNINDLCGFERIDNTLRKRLEEIKDDEKAIKKVLEERYGEAYHYNVRAHRFNKVLSRFINELEQKGEVKLARRGDNLKDIPSKIKGFGIVNVSDLNKDLFFGE